MNRNNRNLTYSGARIGLLRIAKQNSETNRRNNQMMKQMEEKRKRRKKLEKHKKRYRLSLPYYRHHIPKCLNFNSHDRENLKSQKTEGV
jgi:hypothetical protein